ncbi:MAG: amidase family protein [Candidatus Nanopelagicales bacterium]
MTTAPTPDATDPHPPTAALARATAYEIAADLEAGRTTSVEVTRALLERIAAVDHDGVELRAVLAVNPHALDEAARLDAERVEGTVRGPLHGVPVLVKDNIEAVGLPATAGSLALAGRPVELDAPLVAAMRAAGLVVLGATNLSEWANLRSPRSTSGWSAVGGLTGNPWALDRSAGGSSSGSGAAVAGGLAPLAIGTETDGSITCPSSFHGCVGLKPTVGTVSTVGVVPLSGSQDSPGPMARSVRDVALLLDALTSGSAYAAAVGTWTPDEVHLGIAGGWLTGHGPTDEHFAAALERLDAAGLTLTPVDVPEPQYSVGNHELQVLLCETKEDLDAYLAARPGAGVHSLAEVLAFNEEHAEHELAHFGQEYFEMAAQTAGRAEPGYAEARAACLDWAVGTALEPATSSPGGPQILVSPAYPPAWKSDLALGDHTVGVSGTISAAAMAGWPVLCVPMGLVDDLPVGMLLVGRPGSEADLLAAGHVVEQALDLRAQLQPRWTPAQRG